MYTCPVCFFEKLEYPPCDYTICECCGTEFENDDSDTSHDDLREAWIKGGGQWFFGEPPANWNPWDQLYKAHVYPPSLILPASVMFSGGQEAHRFSRTKVQTHSVELDEHFLGKAS
jgi:hypothetical protein